MKLTQENIEKYYENIVARAQKAISKHNIEKACFELNSASALAYNFNFRYADERCERIIDKISEQTLCDCKINFTPVIDRIVLYDAFSWDNRGLTQQYIRALMAKGYEFMYIFGSGKDSELGNSIIKELETYSQVCIVEIDQKLSSADKIRSIYSRVVAYSPQKALLHIAPWSIEALAAFTALDNVTKFNINLTDHAYWLGGSTFDFNIEFRDYGATVSAEKRNLRSDQLLMLPYYPITSDNTFAGFPDITNGKTIIFSGGAVYKVYGENGIYFKIVKRLLDENPNAVLLFAGGGNIKRFKDFIQNNNLEQRVVLLGNRSDINQVFRHSDIYLGTYPFTGGLMSQLAAINGLPILAYTDPKFTTNYVEGIVCQSYNIHITHENLKEFFELGHRLCADKEFRSKKGAELKKCVVSVEQFNDKLDILLKTNSSLRKADKREIINYDAFTNMYFEVENEFQPQIKMLLVARYRLKSIWLFPKLLLMAIPEIFKRLKVRMR